MRGLFVLLVVLAAIHSASCHAQPTPFQENFHSMEAWDVLDLNGDLVMGIENEAEAPTGYGPKVLKVRAGEVCLFVKGARFTEGTLLVLWRDEIPHEWDADGILCFEADYPEDLTQANANKELRPHCWLEQDADAGFQIKRSLTKGLAETLGLKSGIGLTYGDWNESGWFWQKLQITNGMLRARHWPAFQKEPSEWTLEIPGWVPKPGRVGIKIFSGHASVAYFSISEDESPAPPPFSFVIAPTPCYRPEHLKMKLFLNLAEAISGAHLVISTQTPDGAAANSATISGDFPAGFTRIELPDENTPLPLPAGISTALLTAKATLKDANGGLIGEATRPLDLRSPEAIQQKIRELRNKAAGIIDHATGASPRAISEAHAALAHLGLAEERLNADKGIPAERSIAYAEEALDETIRLFNYCFRVESISSDSLVMGETYEACLAWRCLGETPQGALRAHLQLTDALRSMTPVSVALDIPPESWVEGEAKTVFRFRVPEEFPKGRKTPIEYPIVREGWHDLLVSLTGPEGKPEWLDNRNIEPNGAYVTQYQIARRFVTQNPFEIKRAAYIAESNELLADIINHASREASIKLALRIETKGGVNVWTDILPLQLPASSSRVVTAPLGDFPWRGDLKLRAEILEENVSQIRVEQPFEIPFPEGIDVQINRGAATLLSGDAIKTPLEAILKGIDPQKAKVHLSVSRKNAGETAQLGEFELVFSGMNLKNECVQTVLVEPSMGRYLAAFTIETEPGKTFKTELIAQAAVFENRDKVFYLNGEPFIVKGVNVHGMIANSPDRNRHLMKMLKEIGFNSVRGDYPPPWEVEMAEEENLGWMVLPPFSVNNTEYFKGLYHPHPFPRMREITRRFIDTYLDMPAVWYWNSCNEVTCEVQDFVTSLYPLFKQADPFKRPVIYANLFGQNESLAQDAMAVNYYYDIPMSATDRHPQLRESVKIAQDAGLPLMFTEFNCWYGPVYSKGVDAIRGFFEYGNTLGMNGGFLYLLAEDPSRHPAVIQTRETLVANPTFNAALRHAFDDLRILPPTNKVSRESGLNLTAKNVRSFAARKVAWEIREDGRLLASDNGKLIAPGAVLEMPVPGLENPNAAHIFDVDCTFETHHGIRCHIHSVVHVEKAADAVKVSP